MQVTVRGCRGSVPTPGCSTLRYGGNTSCVEVRAGDGSLIVLDAGTGIRALSAEENGDVHLLLTHLHLDHIEGLRFFAPIWTPGTTIRVWGPPSPLHRLRERISRAFSPPLFPVELNDTPAQLVCADVPRDGWTIADVRISALPVQHPGPTVGYRLEADGATLAYIPDHEPALAGELSSLGEDWISGISLARDADVLVHDCQFTEEEYAARVGWGHSSVSDAVTFARRAGVGRLVLFHHDPARSDDELERLAEKATGLAGGAFPVDLAREGGTISV